MSEYKEKYVETISKLIRDPTPDDGFSLDYLTKIENEMRITFPSALKDYYLTIGNFDEFNDDLLYVFNPMDIEMFTFQDMFPDLDRNEATEDELKLLPDDIMDICSDNQGDTHWGIFLANLKEPNPSIIVRDDYHEGCYDTGLKCFDFLIYTIYAQALFTVSFKACSEVDSKIEDKVKNIYTLLFDQNFLKIYSDEGEIVGIQRANKDRLFVILAGQKKEDLLRIRKKLNVELGDYEEDEELYYDIILNDV